MALGSLAYAWDAADAIIASLTHVENQADYISCSLIWAKEAEDVAKAVDLCSISRKAYTYAQHVLNIPLPSNSTLARWTRSFQIGFGVIDAAVCVLRPAVEAMTGLERISCICFDEMALDSMPSYDQSADRILAGSKLQLMVVRGLCSPWKQPIFHELDAPMTMAKLSAVVRTLKELGLDIRAVTSDMGPNNESLWRDAGVDRERTWISHPADPTNARKAGTRRRPVSTSALLPFERGMLRSSASLRGLYPDLTSAYPDQLRLNQDCLENTFSQLRSMCSPNTHPDAVEVRQRLRILLMALSALRAVPCPKRAVEVEAGPDFLSTDAAVTHSYTVSGSALDGLDVLFVDQTAEQAEVDHAYAAVRETPGSADNRADELQAFVAGYVALKMHHIDPTLGCPSAEASEEQLNSVPSSWLSALSRGGLFMPRPWWMAVVCEFDDDFQRIMGSSFCDQPGLLRRLSQVISQRHPGLDQRIARRLARVRMFMRVGELRQQLKRQRDDRRANRQVRQHVTSQR
ncbi:Transposable element P transposase [Amphibalanus amphitrite]|uniref:Transposable element P transposase n=1 Tax=Amphibalanus amphitrite TaxID=1232801 RepID=A0A6A4VEJ9_AMPAM|nr:Transposable element P transposase [Amphibalanus amphitrite]